jgi:hypothetical protein
MNNNEKLRLREREVLPTEEVLKQALCDSYAAYETFLKALPGLDIVQEWMWYTPNKAWFARGQYCGTTPHGKVKKEKTLYWLHVFEGYFCVVVWFKEKNRMEALNAGVSEKTQHLIFDGATMGKMPTFPVVFNISNVEPLDDIYTLIDCKKRIEG